MDISSSKADGILSLEFNRPDKKNAITSAMYQSMADILREGQADPAVRVILIAGKPEIFTAGNDLEDFLHKPPFDGESPVVRFMHALHDTEKPVLAAVAGAAVGIGTTMLLHCDLVYAAENARFALPFTQLGLCPEYGSSLLLPLLAGYQRAAEKLMLGEPFAASEAQAMGLVNCVVPAAELLPLAQAQAARLAALPPASLRATKRLMRKAQEASFKTVMADEIATFGRMLTEPAAKEAFTAFFERRKPDFSKLS